MCPILTFKPLIDSKTALQFPRYRLRRMSCHLYASVQPTASFAYAALRLSVLRTDEAVNYCLYILWEVEK